MTSYRSKTPSELKWLLNERAALAGKLAVFEERRVGMEQLQLRLQKRLVDLKQIYAGAIREAETNRHALNALDRVISTAYACVAPDAAGEVRAWAGKYGKRGGLTQFLLDSLQRAYPAPVPFTVLKQMAAVHFGLTFATTAEWIAFRSPIKNNLRFLRSKGRVESLHDPASNQTSLWRWVNPEAPLSFAQLRAEQEALHEPADTPADGLGSEVAGHGDSGYPGAVASAGYRDSDAERP